MYIVAHAFLHGEFDYEVVADVQRLLQHGGEILYAVSVLTDTENADAVEYPTDEEDNEHDQHHEHGDALHIGLCTLSGDVCE